MSQAQIDEVEEWLKSYATFDGMEREHMVRRTSMVTRAISLQQAGIIPLQTDLVWIEEAVQNVEMASLR